MPRCPTPDTKPVAAGAMMSVRTTSTDPNGWPRTGSASFGDHSHVLAVRLQRDRLAWHGVTQRISHRHQQRDESALAGAQLHAAGLYRSPGRLRGPDDQLE